MHNCLLCGSNQFTPLMKIKDFSISGEQFYIHECNQCKFRFTANPPSAADVGKYYENENYISHSNTNKGLVAKLYHIVRHIMLRRKHRLLTRLSPGNKVLDVGSGTGYFLNYLQQNGFIVQGVEMSDSARDFSIQQFGLDVRKTMDEIEDVGQFNSITLWHVLEHLYDPDIYMQHFKKLLQADGTLMIALPNHDSYDGKKYESYWAAYDVPRHLWHFKPDTFKRFADNNGFTITKKYMMPFDPFYNSILSEKYKQNSFGLLRGFWTGLLANLKGIQSIDRASSVIYILKAK